MADEIQTDAALDRSGLDAEKQAQKTRLREKREREAVRAWVRARAEDAKAEERYAAAKHEREEGDGRLESARGLLVNLARDAGRALHFRADLDGRAHVLAIDPVGATITAYPLLETEEDATGAGPCSRCADTTCADRR